MVADFSRPCQNRNGAFALSGIGGIAFPDIISNKGQLISTICPPRWSIARAARRGSAVHLAGALAPACRIVPRESPNGAGFYRRLLRHLSGRKARLPEIVGPSQALA